MKGSCEWLHLHRLADRRIVLYHSLTMEAALIGTRCADWILDGSPLTMAVPAATMETATDFAVRGYGATTLLDRLRTQALNDTLRVLYLLPTTSCNLRCRYCQVGHPVSDPSIMEPETAINAVNLFARESAGVKGRTIVFYGGEPLLAPRVLLHAIQYVRDREQSLFGEHPEIILFTNGTLARPDVCGFMADNDVTVLVSMDGYAEHNRFRTYPDGRSSWEDAEWGRALFAGAGCRVGLSLVLGRHNCEVIPHLLDSMNSDFQPVSFGLNPLHRSTGALSAEVALDAEEVASCMVRAFATARSAGIYLEQAVRKVRPFVNQNPRLKDCPGMGGKILVTPDGRVGFCESFITTGRYYTSMERFEPRASNDYEKWRRLSPVFRDDCLECPAVLVCGGGCPHDAFDATGQLDAVDEVRCKISRAFLRWLLEELGTHEQASDEWMFRRLGQQERRRLLGTIEIREDLPMQGFSTYGEGL